MNQINLSSESFYGIMTIILSSVSGLLIGVPASSYMISTGVVSPNLGFLVLVFFAIAGGRIGYLRRKDKAFFYVSFFAVLVLSSLIGFSFVETPQQ